MPTMKKEKHRKCLKFFCWQHYFHRLIVIVVAVIIILFYCCLLFVRAASTVCFTEMHRTTEPKKMNSTQTVKYSTSHLLLQCIWHGLNRLYRVFNCSNRNILIPLRPSNVWRRYFVTIYTRLALIQSHAKHILSQLMFDSCSALNPCVAYHSFHSIPLFDSLIYVSGDIFFLILFPPFCCLVFRYNEQCRIFWVCVCVCVTLPIQWIDMRLQTKRPDCRPTGGKTDTQWES